MSSQQFLRLLRSRTPQIRSFTQTSPFLKAKSRKGQPPIPSFKAPAQPAAARAPPVAPRSNAPLQASPPKAAYNPSLPPSRTAETYAAGLLGDAESLLLYKAPKSLALFGLSAVSGAALFYYAGTVANGLLINTTAVWYAKFVVLGGCMVTSAMAMAFIMTPWNLVRTVSLARTAENQVVLRVKGTRFLPFGKPTVKDVTPGQLMVDKDVVMDLDMTNKWYGVELKVARDWTEGKLLNPDAPQGGAISRFNKGLLNAWPTTKKLCQEDVQSRRNGVCPGR